MERELTPEAQADRDSFDSYKDEYGGCSCHLNPPCGYCTHPGNPLCQEDDSCWQEVKPAAFVRENRYIVIKHSDMDKLPKSVAGYANSMLLMLSNIRPHMPKRECLVIESDWPEYEPTWQSIEKRMTGAAPAWTGEGLPPVGVRIEAKHKQANSDWARPDFYETEIVAIGKQLVIFEEDGSGHEKVGRLEDYIFRPIRTPEQIAEEEREEEIKLMVGLIKQWRFSLEKTPENPKQEALIAAEALHAAGYRKQVTE